MTETVERKKIEVLVDAPLAQRVVDIAQRAGVTGYTLLPTLAGAGSSGTWRDDQITGAQTKVIFVTITSDDKAARLIDALTPLLESHGLILSTTAVQVVRASKF